MLIIAAAVVLVGVYVLNMFEAARYEVAKFLDIPFSKIPWPYVGKSQFPREYVPFMKRRLDRLADEVMDAVEEERLAYSQKLIYDYANLYYARSEAVRNYNHWRRIMKSFGLTVPESAEDHRPFGGLVA